MKVKTTSYFAIALLLMVIAIVLGCLIYPLRMNMEASELLVFFTIILMLLLTAIALLIAAVITTPQKIKARINAFAYAFKGIATCFSSELHFRWHCYAALITLLLGLLFSISLHEWMIVFVCIGMVLAAELLNSAVEHLCDVVHPEYHPAIKKIKDMAAGAVLVLALCSIAVALCIFLPKVIFHIHTF